HGRQPWHTHVTQTVINGAATALVGARSHQSPRFVEHQVDGFGRFGVAVVNDDIAGVERRASLRIEAHASTDLHPTRSDPLLSLAARTQTALAENTRQPVTRRARAHRLLAFAPDRDGAVAI